MKILCLHSDYIKVRPTKRAIKNADEIEKKEMVSKETLVIFTSVEKGDEKNTKEVVESGVKEIKNVYEQVKAKEIVIYPYVHLSQKPSSPATAQKVLNGLFDYFKKEKYEVQKMPFGWYKAFEISVKGHPLSELSREIKPESESEEEEDFDYKKLLREISKTKIMRDKLEPNDHRILGQEMDLFSFSEMAPGMVFWHDKGYTIYKELVEYWREEHRKAGYKEISTPQILDKKLWCISGHWNKYKENIFLTDYEERKFAVKPMNCPGGILIFKNSPKSYKDFPLRVGELGVVYRQELSGVLGGLFRVIKFTQDDAHIYCMEEQLESEIINIIELTDKFYKKFGFSYSVELSTRPQKRIGTDEMWDRAEDILKNVLEKKKIKHKINEGDGAFYGPKIDFHVKDSLNRTWQCATIQLDFAMPERFDLKYTGKDNKEHKPVMVHRTVYGSMERFIGILLEHTNGHLPIWLAPVQAKILSFTDRNKETSKKLYKEFEKEGIRAEIDLESAPMQGRIRNAELEKIPYIIVIGDKEEEKGTIAVRRNGKIDYGVNKDEFIKDIKNEIKERS